MNIENMLEIAVSPAENADWFHIAYKHKEESSIVCLYIECCDSVCVEAIGGGEHPCIDVSTATEQYAELTFMDFDSSWLVWSASADKRGIAVTLLKREQE